MCIWRHKLCNAKTGVGPTFTWSNEPWYSLLSFILLSTTLFHWENQLDMSKFLYTVVRFGEKCPYLPKKFSNLSDMLFDQKSPDLLVLVFNEGDKQTTKGRTLQHIDWIGLWADSMKKYTLKNAKTQVMLIIW